VDQLAALELEMAATTATVDKIKAELTADVFGILLLLSLCVSCLSLSSSNPSL
jgi:hypothetical protein